MQPPSSEGELNRCRLDTFACQFECGAYREHRRKLDMTAGRLIFEPGFHI